jgi:hypothetical protein
MDGRKARRAFIVNHYRERIVVRSLWISFFEWLPKNFEGGLTIPCRTLEAGCGLILWRF